MLLFFKGAIIPFSFPVFTCKNKKQWGFCLSCCQYQHLLPPLEFFLKGLRLTENLLRAETCHLVSEPTGKLLPPPQHPALLEQELFLGI